LPSVSLASATSVAAETPWEASYAEIRRLRSPANIAERSISGMVSLAARCGSSAARVAVAAASALLRGASALTGCSSACAADWAKQGTEIRASAAAQSSRCGRKKEGLIWIGRDGLGFVTRQSQKLRCAMMPRIAGEQVYI